MMCRKCGNVVEDGTRFCTNCGAEVEQVEKGPDGKRGETSAQDNGSKENAQQKLKKIPRKFFIIGAVIIVAVACIIAFASRRPEIGLNDYLEINTYGYNGYGYAEFSFDDENMVKAHMDIFAQGDDDSTESLYAEISLYEDIDALISGDFDIQEDLSNGDTITFSWNMDEDIVSAFEKKYQCRLKYSDIKYDVDGLEAVEEVDPFDEKAFTVTLDGMSGNAYVSVSNNTYPAIKYELSEDIGVSNGDVITVTASLPGDTETNGLILTRDTFEYTVEGLDGYVNDISQIPEDFVTEMVSSAEDEMKAEVDDRWDNPEWYQSMSYTGSYLAVEKPDAFAIMNPDNRIYMVFEVNADSEQGMITYYVFFTVDDVILKSDGTCFTDQEAPDLQSKYAGSFDVGDTEYVGFETMDDLYNEVIVPEMEANTFTDNFSE